jgi:lysyl-tRNA synthetase class 1
MKIPKQPGFHVPYNLLTYLAKVSPKNSEEEYMTEKLRSYGYLGRDQMLDETASARIQYASNWAMDFQEIKEVSTTLSKDERVAIQRLIEILRTEDNADKIQNAVFATAKQSSLQPAGFFKAVYRILLGTPQGPRLGPYILAMGKQNVIDAMERTLKNQT